MPINTRDAELKLNIIGYRAGNMRPVMLGRIADQMREMFRKIFDSKGWYIQENWPALAPATIYRKLMRGQGYDHPLRATDALFKSLTEKSAKGSIARMFDATTLEFGTSNDVSVFHIHGTQNMPARRFIPTPDKVPEQEVNRWCEAIVDYLEEK